MPTAASRVSRWRAAGNVDRDPRLVSGHLPARSPADPLLWAFACGTLPSHPPSSFTPARLVDRRPALVRDSASWPRARPAGRWSRATPASWRRGTRRPASRVARGGRPDATVFSAVRREPLDGRGRGGHGGGPRRFAPTCSSASAAAVRWTAPRGSTSSSPAAAGCRTTGAAARPPARMLPSIAVPTTAGTGSETQSFALITDAATRHEDGLRRSAGPPSAWRSSMSTSRSRSRPAWRRSTGDRRGRPRGREPREHRRPRPPRGCSPARPGGCWRQPARGSFTGSDRCRGPGGRAARRRLGGAGHRKRDARRRPRPGQPADRRPWRRPRPGRGADAAARRAVQRPGLRRGLRRPARRAGIGSDRRSADRPQTGRCDPPQPAGSIARGLRSPRPISALAAAAAAGLARQPDAGDARTGRLYEAAQWTAGFNPRPRVTAGRTSPRLGRGQFRRS